MGKGYDNPYGLKGIDPNSGEAGDISSKFIDDIKYIDHQWRKFFDYLYFVLIQKYRDAHQEVDQMEV